MYSAQLADTPGRREWHGKGSDVFETSDRNTREDSGSRLERILLHSLMLFASSVHFGRTRPKSKKECSFEFL